MHLIRVAGNNLFGQWLIDTSILEQFSPIYSNIFNNITEFPCVTWSYNVVKQRNAKLHAVGSWTGQDNQFQELIFPDNNVKICDLVINGNDYYLICGDKNSNIVYTLEIETLKWKKINLFAETPVNIKRKKLNEGNTLKIAVYNDNILYLNDSGNVYSGLLPTYVDTSKCVGTIIDIECGYEHNIILTDQGLVYTWGNGRRLQLGLEDVSETEIPTLVEALSGIKIIKIAAGGWHSMALSEFGDLYAWGWNNNGQLGIFTEDLSKTDLNSHAIPTLVDFFDHMQQKVNDIFVKDIACGSKHSVALLQDNTVWITGNNKYGQLGLNVSNQPIVKYFKKSLIDENVLVKSLECSLWTTMLIS